MAQLKPEAQTATSPAALEASGVCGHVLLLTLLEADFQPAEVGKNLQEAVLIPARATGKARPFF